MQLQKGTSAEQQAAATLLAALAMDSDASEQITKSGGVMLAVAGLNSKVSMQTLEATMRMIARLALNANNIDAIIASGAVKQIIDCLTNPNASAELLATALEVL